MHAAPSRRATGLVAASLVLAIVSAACGSDAGEDVKPAAGSRAVTFESSDGVKLAGRVFGEGSHGVVLAHMRPADQRSWFDFADRLAGEGYRVLTFDFRGYCPGGSGGCSQGDRDTAENWKDVVGAVAELRSLGADDVALIGASMGGTASLIAAAQPGVDPRAVITLSAPTDFEGLSVTPDVLSTITAGKLFIAGVGDAEAATSAQTLYDESPPPKDVQIVPADDHGTELLNGSRGEDVKRMIEVALERNGV
jgi:pimeloyl-ACP methyl ester carboxylesterase